MLTITYTLASLPMLKASWELTTMTILTLNMIFMATNQLTSPAFMLSENLMLDPLSSTLVSLSMWIISITLLTSYQLKTKTSPKMFLWNLMLLLTTLMMCFSTNNLLFFYILFEMSLIPVLMLITLWGYQPERKSASFYIVLYTITASLPMLMMLLKMYIMNHHMNFSFNLCLFPASMNQHTAWMMLMVPFMVKLPLFSLHAWLPKAHVEAPLAGSMILAAILLKLGGYGLMRMNKMMQKQAPLMPHTIMSVALIGAVITNIMCLRQTDLKTLIAYSSVGHMSLLIISTLSNSKLGQYGSLIIMLAHGLTSSCMFLLSNYIYEHTHSRNILLTNSMLTLAPQTSLMWVLASLSNMALPPSLSIIGEIIAMMSSLLVLKMMITVTMTTSLLTTTYSLYLYSMINHGNQLALTNPRTQLTSIDLTSITSHLWPLLVTTPVPMKLMLWC